MDSIAAADCSVGAISRKSMVFSEVPASEPLTPALAMTARAAAVASIF